MTRRLIRTVAQADASPQGSVADDGWGHQYIRRGDAWVREIWIESAELLADGPVETEDPE
ncbi:hypothetical protein ACFWU5_16775 [Nocardia sp. NPDC058640]|uniref:hypothetical protein n=1 Tax=Nocardia sp. NPDC058640 TaxID=3346571 RepID=UPI003646D9CF